MEYKYKEGDKVRLKPGVDLEGLGISVSTAIKGLRTEVLTITDATPGMEGWFNPDLDGKPSYTVDGWRLPESYLVLAKEESREEVVTIYKIGDKVKIIDMFHFPLFVGKEATVTKLGGQSINSGVVITGDDIPCGHKSYGEHGMWFPDEWIEKV